MVCVENTGKTKLVLRCRVSLMPGVNEVDVDKWHLCREDPITRHYLDTKRIRVCSNVQIEQRPELPSVDTSTESTCDSEDDSLQEQNPVQASEPMVSRGISNGEEPHVPVGMSAVDARAFVKSCRRPNVLESLLEVETRSSIRAAIEKRLQQLA